MKIYLEADTDIENPPDGIEVKQEITTQKIGQIVSEWKVNNIRQSPLVKDFVVIKQIEIPHFRNKSSEVLFEVEYTLMNTLYYIEIDDLEKLRKVLLNKYRRCLTVDENNEFHLKYS